MPRNGSGTYNPTAGQPVVSGTLIDSTVFNALVADMGRELTASVATDGQTPMVANLPMGANKITNLGAGILTSDAVRVDQVATILTTSISALDTGAANTCTVSYSPAITALTDSMVLWFTANAANTGSTTLNVNGLGAKPLVGAAHSALQGGEIIVGGKCQVVWSTNLNSFVLIECTSGALQVAPATQSKHAVNLGQFVSSLTINGYVKLPNGLILQWLYSVVVSVVGGTQKTISATLVTPLTNILFAAPVSIFTTGSNNGVFTSTGTATSTTVSAYVNSAISQDIIVQFLVIGV